MDIKMTTIINLFRHEIHIKEDSSIAVHLRGASAPIWSDSSTDLESTLPEAISVVGVGVQDTSLRQAIRAALLEALNTVVLTYVNSSTFLTISFNSLLKTWAVESFCSYTNDRNFFSDTAEAAGYVTTLLHEECVMCVFNNETNTFVLINKDGTPDVVWKQ